MPKHVGHLLICVVLAAVCVGGCEARGSSPENPVYTDCWPEAPQ